MNKPLDEKAIEAAIRKYETARARFNTANEAIAAPADKLEKLIRSFNYSVGNPRDGFHERVRDICAHDYCTSSMHVELTQNLKLWEELCAAMQAAQKEVNAPMREVEEIAMALQGEFTQQASIRIAHIEQLIRAALAPYVIAQAGMNVEWHWEQILNAVPRLNDLKLQMSHRASSKEATRRIHSLLMGLRELRETAKTDRAN